MPPALLTGYETPGQHSANAVTRFAEEIDGPLRGGDPGARLIEPGHAALPTSPPRSRRWRARACCWCRCTMRFPAPRLSRASALLAARAPAPRLLLHPDDAAALGLAAGAAVLIDGARCAAALTLEPDLARGVVAISARHAVAARAAAPGAGGGGAMIGLILTAIISVTLIMVLLVVGRHLHLGGAAAARPSCRSGSGRTASGRSASCNGSPTR